MSRGPLRIVPPASTYDDSSSSVDVEIGSGTSSRHIAIVIKTYGGREKLDCHRNAYFACRCVLLYMGSNHNVFERGAAQSHLAALCCSKPSSTATAIVTPHVSRPIKPRWTDGYLISRVSRLSVAGTHGDHAPQLYGVDTRYEVRVFTHTNFMSQQ